MQTSHDLRPDDSSTSFSRVAGNPGRGKSGASRAELDLLFETHHEALLNIAGRRLQRERRNHPFSKEALLNETYLRFCRRKRVSLATTNDFLGAVSATMRWILTDYARARLRDKRGGEWADVSVEELEPYLSYNLPTDGDLSWALRGLSELCPRLYEVVEQRCFQGFSAADSAERLGISTRTLQRDWNQARAWLHSQLETAS